MSIFLNTRHILLADDDKDDSMFFQDILDELPLNIQSRKNLYYPDNLSNDNENK